MFVSDRRALLKSYVIIAKIKDDNAISRGERFHVDCQIIILANSSPIIFIHHFRSDPPFFSFLFFYKSEDSVP